MAPDALARSAPAAWVYYDGLVDAGTGHADAWRALMTRLLEGAEVATPDVHARWLYDVNAEANLWRRPIRPMFELARELADRGAIVAVLSNSEGRLADLFAEIGLADNFVAIVDSGRVGLEKPDPRIFAHTLAAVGAPDARAIHIGDSWDADIVGARNAGWRAIWYGRRVTPVDAPDVAVARDPGECRAALVQFGVL
ncbi:MAG TPA: HAD-IA family hydrolase [Kofleriaceae bacterium]|nr:HAD-IA family hydrolase [Kofleriaceae bacterium]